MQFSGRWPVAHKNLRRGIRRLSACEQTHLHKCRKYATNTHSVPAVHKLQYIYICIYIYIHSTHYIRDILLVGFVVEVIE